MSRSATAVVIVDPEGVLAARVDAALAESEEGDRLRLEAVASTEDVPARVAADAADVVLLPLPQPDHQGVLPALELRAAVPDVPLVVLCRAEYEPIALKAVQLGASDYLLSDRLYGTLVGRCLRHAVEVERMRRQLAGQEARWTSALRAESDAEVRAASLRNALPEGFAKLVAEYRHAVDRSVVGLLHPDTPRADSGMERLARQAGRLGASARDLIEIHATVMKEKEGEEGPQRARLYLAEGRLHLLEVLGHLVGYYRARARVGHPSAE